MTNSHIRHTGGRNSERNHGSPQPPSSATINGTGFHGSQRKNGRGQQKSPNSAIFFQRNHSISPTLAKTGSSSPTKLGRSDNTQTTPNGHHNQQQQHNQFYSQRQTPPMAIASYHHQQPYHQQQYNNSHYNGSHHNHRASPGSHHSGSSSTSSSPPNITLFAGSKCYDAPAPTALPRPPVHWTSCSMAFSGTTSIGGASDNEFSHNLKMMLNVGA